LLYVVCSVFPEEGREQIAGFMAQHPEAVLTPLPGGAPLAHLLPTAPAAEGWTAGQPRPTVHDGFFYARLEKSS
jgi:16S rRNA (cytosine967-C5)-methyltransferase